MGWGTKDMVCQQSGKPQAVQQMDSCTPHEAIFPVPINQTKKPTESAVLKMQTATENTVERVSLPWPPMDLSPNSRVHWSKKSKAAKMVKEIYAKHRIKEDMYDHEKDDKGPGTYGKPPKIDKKTEINSDDEKGVNARMVLKGGTTLTGEKRDTIEIDPMMKNRNKSPDYMSQDPKKQQQKPKEQ